MSYRAIRYMSGCAAVILMAACVDRVTSVDPESVDVEFVTEIAFGSPVSDVTMSAGVGLVEVTGTLTTPQGGYELRAEFGQSGRTYEVTVVATEVSGGITIPIPYRYQVTLRGLLAGTYEMRVVHAFESATQSRTVVLQRTLEVQ